MQFFHEIDHEKRRMRTVFTGHITLEGQRRHIEERRAKGAMGYAQLIDATGGFAVFTATEAQQIGAAMQKCAARESIGRTAIVTNDDLSFGMFRIFEAYADGVYELRIFRSVPEAMVFLGWAETAE